MKKILLRVVLVVVLLTVMISAYMGYFFMQLGVVSKGVPIVLSGEEKPALLVIDIQEGITGKLASLYTRGLAHQSETFIQKVNLAIEKAHREDMPVIYIRHENTDQIVNFMTGGKFLKTGTAGTEIDSRVSVVPGPVFIKGKGDSFSNQKLDDYLRTRQINHLYMTGLDATQCVHKTIQGARQRGYKVTAISDALIAATVEKKEKVLVEYEQEGVMVMKMEQWQ